MGRVTKALITIQTITTANTSAAPKPLDPGPVPGSEVRFPKSRTTE